MIKSWICPLVFALAMAGATMPTRSQETAATPSADEVKEREKVDREKRAFILLDQVTDDAQLLRLPENRTSVQINTADLVWDRNQGRARSLFNSAAEAVAEMMRITDDNASGRGGNSGGRTAGQLRQQLVLAAARHDANLAYQLLAMTRTPSTSTTTSDRNLRGRNSDDNLEQLLLARIAALDPALAMQNAQQVLEKGQFPRTLASVLEQLQRKDKEAAAKLEEMIFKRLQAANMLTSQDAGPLALRLLQPGPRVAESSNGESTQIAFDTQPQLLTQSNYRDLLGTVIDAALKAVPPPSGATNQRGNISRRRATGITSGGNNAPTDAQLEQSNARMLLGGLQLVLPQIDQYLPARAPAVREKLTELGMVDNNRANMSQLFTLMRQGSADSLLTAASTAPPQMQPRIYQQAALKALDEGNADRARQIATDHLDASARDRVLQQVEFRKISEKAEAANFDQLRLTLAGLRSDDVRLDLLLQLSKSNKDKNPKLALQLLEQAKQLTNRRATNYRQFEQQLMVADAFRDLEPASSFEVLEGGILQLNELLSAAATLSGFEVNVFRDGELPLDSRNNLSGMVSRFGQTLGSLAQSDFARAQALANRFQLTEARILARLSIVQSLLGREQPSNDFGNRPNALIRPFE